MEKIALYIPDLRRGGAERAVSKFSEILKDCYDLDIILHEAAVEYPVYGSIIDMNLAPSAGIIRKIVVNIRRIYKLKKLKKVNGYKCVISFLNNANIVNILSRTRNTRVAVSIRNYYDANIYNKITSITTGLLDILYNRADVVIPVTKHLGEMLKRKGIPQNKIVTLYNPFNVADIRKKMNEDVLTDNEKKFAEGRFMLTYVGRLSHQKGIWNLLKAFRRLSERPDVGLFIVGGGEQQEIIKKYINIYNMKNVMVVGQKENPFAYISQAGTFILPSLAEGFPNVVGEALACGAAVISTDCKTGPREILAPDVSLEQPLPEIFEAQYGLLVSPVSGDEEWDKFCDDDERIYRAICKFVDSGDMVARYRSKAIERANDFDYKSARETMQHIIKGE